MQTKFMTLPIAGSIRHGEKQEKNGRSKPVELGHFVAKIQDDAMSHLLDKFKTKYSQSKILNIYFFDEDPLSIRRVRYNTGGTTCYCKLDDTKAMEKVKNSDIRLFNFDALEYLKEWERISTPYTPPISILKQLELRLKKIQTI